LITQLIFYQKYEMLKTPYKVKEYTTSDEKI